MTWSDAVDQGTPGRTRDRAITAMKPAIQTLKQLMSRLDAQAAEMASLRAELDVQFTRIARMQAELDLALAQRIRQSPVVRMSEAASHNGRHRRQG